MSDKVTRVVNISEGRNRDIHIATGFHIYIGRPGTWGNPFHIGRDGTRTEVVKKHREWLMGLRDAPDGSKPPTIAEIKRYLKGKRLGCYCPPLACHGDNYVLICEGKNDSKEN